MRTSEVEIKLCENRIRCLYIQVKDKMLEIEKLKKHVRKLRNQKECG
jgi:hypothetical protein